MTTSGDTSRGPQGPANRPKARQRGGETPRTPQAPADAPGRPDAPARRQGRRRAQRRSSAPTGRPVRLVAYCRVSTADQAIHGVSLADQQRRLRRYAEAHGFDLVGIEVDRGLSARNTRRPALQRALALLRRGEADGLAAVRLDRFSRSIRDVVDLVARSEREGWQLHSLAERLDTSSPVGRFTVHLLGALSQLEREQAAERTRQAMDELRRRGRRISGKPPYGFRFDGDRVVEVPAEQALLERMRALRDEGLGAKAIANRLSEAGDTKPRTGRPWFHRTVRDVLGR